MQYTDNNSNPARLRAEWREAMRRRAANADELRDAYFERRKAEEARRDKLRAVYATAAAALGVRVGKLRGVTVESTEADDFGRAELCMTIDGKRYWTSPIEMSDPRAYARVRDAISARRREDRRAAWWRVLWYGKPWRRVVDWNGFEQVRFGENTYGTKGHEWQ